MLQPIVAQFTSRGMPAAETEHALLDLAQQRVAGVLVHAGQARYGFALFQGFGHEQRLDQLVELDVHLTRQRAHVLVLPQAAQIE